MADSSRTNTLHEKLPVEVRKAIERDLVEQPPGRETYEKVFEHYKLAGLGISIKALQRYGGYLRALARNRWIGELADCVVGRDLRGDIAGLVRSRLYEALVTGETKLGDLLKAAITEKALTESQIKSEEWQGKREAAKRALAESEKDAKKDPQAAIATLREAVRTVYGIEGGN